MQKCLKEKCPNHCCSNRFKGMSAALKNTDDRLFLEIQLNNNEVKRIIENGKNDLIVNIDGKSYLKLNSDNSCSAFLNGKCSIYEIRPDVCKLYPYYFDPFYGICIDKNCPGEFDLNISKREFYELLNNRIDLFDEPKHFFFDGYNIDNNILNNTSLVNEFIQEVSLYFNHSKKQSIIIPYFNGKVKEDGGISAIILGNQFHFTCHTFSYKNTVFIDCYGGTDYEQKLLPIILKYFPTTNFDLCRNNSNENGNFGKHIILKSNERFNYNYAISLIKKILKAIQMTPISELITIFKDDNNFDILQPIAESHISIHVSKDISVIDIFSCKFFEEKNIINLLEDFIQNTTIIRRGINYK